MTPVGAHDEAARRQFWARQMEDAHAFMQAIEVYPLAECGEPLIPLREAVATAGVTVLFSSEKHVLGLDRLFYLRAGLVPAFLAAASDFNARRWALKVEDGYRTPHMQKHLALRPDLFARIYRQLLWELGGATPSLELLRRRAAALIARNPKVGTHVSGSAMDVSVCRLADGREVDRGGPYLEMSEKTPMRSPFVSTTARENRATITELMARHGFHTYPWEFWHYNQGDAYAECLAQSGRPGRYGPVEFDPQSGRVTPIADSTRPLNSPEELEARLQALVAP